MIIVWLVFLPVSLITFAQSPHYLCQCWKNRSQVDKCNCCQLQEAAMEEELPGGWSLGWRNMLDCPKGLDWALVPGWAELHRRWKLVGQLGTTARHNRKSTALCPRCWTGTLRMMARKRRYRESGQMTSPSVYWLKSGVLKQNGSTLLLLDGEVPHWSKMMDRTDVLKRSRVPWVENHCLLHLSMRQRGQLALTGTLFGGMVSCSGVP